jgi:HK97 gp10 family phage protein
MIKNKAEFDKKINKHINDSQAHVKKAIAKSAIYVQGVAQKNIMKGSKTGITVKKYNPRRTHIQSAAGESPASDTGFLVGSISHSVKKDGSAVVGEVVASAEYAAALEFGTVNMKARPFLQPALNQSAEKVKSIFKREGLIR